MEIPDGYKVAESNGQVLRLLKSLYGLKQAPRSWNQVLHNFMKGQQMKQHVCDPAVYSRGTGKNQLIVAVYVDDSTIMSSNLEEILKMKDALSRRFQMTDLGEVAAILGIRVSRDKEAGTLSLSQEKYINTILQKFGMAECTGKRTPMVVGERLTRNDCPVTEEEKLDMEGVPFREAVGSLMFVMTCSRPDIARAVSCVSAFMHNPGRVHWMAVKRIFQYLKHTSDYGLQYVRDLDWTLTGYADSDWGGDADTQKSTTGYVFIAGGAAVSWCSKKQSVVARSSTEAEHSASAQAGGEATWLQEFVKELKPGAKFEAIRIFSDNQANLKMMQKHEARGRTRHIAIQKAYVRDLMEKGIAAFEWIGIEEQVADSLTKAVNENKVNYCRERFGVLKLELN